MMGYDELGHMVYQKLGNGTETEYTYDDVRQRLQEMNLTASGNPLMQNKYEYDKVDNILRLTKPENHNGERMHYAYTYDFLPMISSQR